MKIFSEIRPIFSVLLRNKTGPLLVALQIAVSLAILVNAIYIVNLRLDSAARPSGLSEEMNLFRVDISNQRPLTHEESIAMQKQETETIRAVPGVVSVARTNSFPLSYSGSNSSARLTLGQTTSTASPAYYVSADSLIKTWGLKLIEGRDFQQDDILEVDKNISKEFVKNVIVSETLARKLFPDQTSFVGKEFYFSGDNLVRIVGVVEGLQTSSAQQGSTGEFTVLIPARLSNEIYDGYAVRAEAGQRDRVMKDVAEALRKASTVALNVKTRSMEFFRDRRYQPEKGVAWMLLTVSALLVVITASGIVGMSTLWVAQRRKQIGIRRALGAQRLDILSYFMTENWLITTSGIVVGTMLALGLNQVLVTHFELPALPINYLFYAPFVFWLLGFAAVYMPAWRAASISPATATRGI
jgi:putative ABC transport system permease protein